MPRKVILFIAASLDGYIASPDDDLSFLDAMHREGEDYGYAELCNRVDTVLIGRKTFDWVFAQIKAVPHPDKQTFVLTRSPRNSIGNTQFYANSVPALVQTLKSQEGKDIFCEGGAEIIHELLCQGLIDEIVLSVVPILLGQGTRLFKEGFPAQVLRLVSVKQFESGLVQLHYTKSEQ